MRIIPVFAALLAVSQPVFAANLLSVSWDGSVFSIDTVTGNSQSIGPTGFTGLNSLARNSNSQFFTVSGNALFTSNSTLLQVDPLTGSGTALGVIPGLPAGTVRALSFSPGGTLFAVVNGGGSFAIGVADDLYTIALDTQTPALVGNTGFTGLQGLAFDDKGNLYGWDVGTSGAGLITLNASTGTGSDVNPLIGEENTDIQGLGFGLDGTLYGVRNQLFTINPATGVPASIGSGGYSDFRGIEAIGAPRQLPGPVTSVIPEPASAGLLGFGFLAAAGLLRRRKGKP